MTARTSDQKGDHKMSDTPFLQASDEAAGAVQKSPNRVTLDKIKAKVRSVKYLNPETIPHMTIAVVLLQNGFAVTGQSAPADAANFDRDLGEQFALEDALRRVWPLEAYLLREYLADEEASRRDQK